MLVAAVAVGFLGWWGLREYQFRQSRKAAEDALAKYDFPAARTRLSECMGWRPGDPEIRLLAAQAARRDGAFDEAQDQLIRYREIAGLTEPWRLESSLQSVAAGQIESEVKYLMTLADTRHPAAEQILETLALGSVESYRFDRAGFWVSQLLKHFPQNPVGRLLTAQNLVLRGRHDQAASLCREILADNPRFLKVRTYLADILYKAQKYEEGVEAYRELLALRPGEAEPLLGLAQCLERLGRTDEARPLMAELEARHAGDSEVLLECGQFAVKEGRLADAERLLRRANQIAPNDHEIHFQLGRCLELLGRLDESRYHLDEFKRIEADLRRMELLLAEIAKDPGDPSPRREVGTICLRNGQTQEGLRWLNGVLETHPGDPATLRLLATYAPKIGSPVAGNTGR